MLKGCYRNWNSQNWPHSRCRNLIISYNTQNLNMAYHFPKGFTKWFHNSPYQAQFIILVIRNIHTTSFSSSCLCYCLQMLLASPSFLLSLSSPSFLWVVQVADLEGFLQVEINQVNLIERWVNVCIIANFTLGDFCWRILHLCMGLYWAFLEDI